MIFICYMIHQNLICTLIDELNTFQSLINMGFIESISMNAVQKFGKNINECINYINNEKNSSKSQQTNKNKNV